MIARLQIMLHLSKENIKEILGNFVTDDDEGDKNISLVNASIEKLLDGIFEDADFKDIKKLDLSNNEISSISSRKFKGLESLLELYL